MGTKEIRIGEEYSHKKAITYGFAIFTTQAIYQAFTFLVFTFYFAVVGINVVLISIGFIIWSIWNSVNDPLIGYMSDRTNSRWGRRLPYIFISILPLALVVFLLFTPPSAIGIDGESTNFVYFLIIILIFELFYTIYTLNIVSLFPEIFITQKERTTANNIRSIFLIVGLIMAFILPSLFISDYSDPNAINEYQIFGLALGGIFIAGGLIFILFGPRGREEFKEEYRGVSSFFNSMKTCLKNKSYRWFIPAALANWFVLGILPTIFPLYGKFVLGIKNSLLLSLLLGLTFISAVLFITLVWRPVAQKIGLRKAWIASMTVWIITLIPILFIENIVMGYIVFFLMGMGLAGSIYFLDLVLSDIIDEDEVNYGKRREGGYYGVSAFITRLSTALVFLAISLVFTYVGWALYEPEKATVQVIMGLKILMVIFPIIALGIGIICMYKYPLDDKYLSEIKEQLDKIHIKKRERI
ncbi:MAG: MFS transporter [Promethearchaeota archaeon]|nr:MAG: MFS transporter [Candidatus Lokiarchaeota archaeon]